MSDFTNTKKEDDIELGPLLQEGVDGLQVVLSTAGPQGKVAAAAIEVVEMLFRGDLSKIFDHSISGVARVVEKASGGKIKADYVENAMRDIFRNNAVSKTLEAVIKGISELVATYIIEPVKKGIDFTMEKAVDFFGKLGGFAKPLQDVAVEYDRSIDKMLDGVEENIRNSYKSIEEFNFPRDEARNQLLKASTVLAKGQEALESAQSAAASLSQVVAKPSISNNISESVGNEAIKIMAEHNIQATGDVVDAKNAQAPLPSKDQGVQKESGHSR